MDTPQQGKRKTPEQHKKLARLLSNDTPVTKALVAAGWSPAQAAKGWEAVPDVVLVKLPAKAKKLIALGKTDKDTRRNLVRGRLVSNTISGRDGGSMSAKILGSDKELSMWEAESQTGVVVLSAPQSLIDKKEELLKD
jgi:hypothetical protein